MFFSFCVLFSVSAGGLRIEEYSLQNQIDKIDEKICSLEKTRGELKKNVVKHLDKAHRWQFSSEMSIDSRREYDLAAQGDDKIAIIDFQLLELKKEKKELLDRR